VLPGYCNLRLHIAGQDHIYQAVWWIRSDNIVQREVLPFYVAGCRNPDNFTSVVETIDLIADPLAALQFLGEISPAAVE